jgi:RHS repeat-associated protein
MTNDKRQDATPGLRRLGQVISGKKFWSDGTPVAGQQFQYGFDDIGNRTSTKTGGDQNGANLRSANYTTDLLNRYSSREVPGVVDVMGLCLATNTVTVNNVTPYRHGEYFRQEITGDNSSAPLWQAVNVSAMNEASVSGHQFVPRTPEYFGYDADGNLTSDGHWNYGWDAENRLVAITNKAFPAPSIVLHFEYDVKGRRIHKQVWNNADGSGTPDTDVEFLYDGWNLMAVLRSDFSPLNTFLWGSDLSGTPQGAGGVGGLLALSYRGSQTTNCFVAFDGNGNVGSLIDAATGTVAAQYEYGPFGEVIRATGSMARANPFRFSTKYQDDESDLLYYGYRYYNASHGRWLSVDPNTEQAFRLMVFSRQAPQRLGAYTFVRNNSVSLVDLLGLCTPGCNRAGCVVRVVPYARGGDIKDVLAELVELADETESFGRLFEGALTSATTVVSSFAETAANALGGAANVVSTSPSGPIAQAAADLLEAVGRQEGWTPYIQVTYQTCLPRCRLFKGFYTEPGYWKDLAGSKGWEKVEGGDLLGNDGFSDVKQAYAAGVARCKEKQKPFKASNKMCN